MLSKEFKLTCSFVVCEAAAIGVIIIGCCLFKSNYSLSVSITLLLIGIFFSIVSFYYMIQNSTFLNNSNLTKVSPGNNLIPTNMEHYVVKLLDSHRSLIHDMDMRTSIPTSYNPTESLERSIADRIAERDRRIEERDREIYGNRLHHQDINQVKAPPEKTIKRKEYYEIICKRCKKIITGFTVKHVRRNFKLHELFCNEKHVHGMC